MRITRLARIVVVALKHGLDEFALGHERTRALRPLVNSFFFWRDLSSPRAVRLRQALEDLGPIFVKFGQMLSTRRDLLPTDIADELAKLQDRVPPFSSAQVVSTLTRIYRKPLDQVFKSFDPEPVASASVAQVHLAQLPDASALSPARSLPSRCCVRISSTSSHTISRSCKPPRCWSSDCGRKASA